MLVDEVYALFLIVWTSTKSLILFHHLAVYQWIKVWWCQEV